MEDSSSLSLYDKFQRDGYLHIRGFASEAACDELRAEAERLIEAFDPTEAVSIFSTLKQTTTTDQYFLSSGDKISFFFEEDAFDEKGQLKQSKARSINKIGHALADRNELFRKFTHSDQMRQLAKDVRLTDPLVLQSMHICKQPRIGGVVKAHQDSTFVHTVPDSTVGFWIALEDATKNNGCLWALPGSHKTPLPSRFVRNADNASVSYKPPLSPDAYPTSLDAYVPLECKKGDIIVIHGHVVHLSLANTSPHSRHAYTFHMMSASSKYSEDNWLQRPADFPFQPL